MYVYIIYSICIHSSVKTSRTESIQSSNKGGIIGAQWSREGVWEWWNLIRVWKKLNI